MGAVSASHRSQLPSLSRLAMSSAPKVIAAGVWASEGLAPTRQHAHVDWDRKGKEGEEGRWEEGVMLGGMASRNAGELWRIAKKIMVMVEMRHLKRRDKDVRTRQEGENSKSRNKTKQCNNERDGVRTKC